MKAYHGAFFRCFGRVLWLYPPSLSLLRLGLTQFPRRQGSRVSPLPSTVTELAHVIRGLRLADRKIRTVCR